MYLNLAFQQLFCLNICYKIQVPRGGQIVQEAKQFQGCTSLLPLTFRAYGPSSGVTLIQQCCKRHCYIAANKPCIRFLKAHFFFFFAWSMRGVEADRELPGFKPSQVKSIDLFCCKNKQNYSDTLQ